MQLATFGPVSYTHLDVYKRQLLGIDNCIITPHMAWSPKEMRQAVIDVLAENLQSWLNGGRLNRVE